METPITSLQHLHTKFFSLRRSYSDFSKTEFEAHVLALFSVNLSQGFNDCRVILCGVGIGDVLVDSGLFVRQRTNQKC